MVKQGREPPEVAVPIVVVPDARSGLARAASLIHGHPTHHMGVVGLTGTNGKTTTAYLVRSVLQSLGHRTGIMGTLGNRLDDVMVDSRHNTPEADELTRIAAWMRAGGATHLLMEVTSHGIAERRVDGVRFEVAAFSNLTRDHLDLHGSMEAYGAAKARLFIELAPQHSAIVVDGDFGADLAGRLTGEVLRVSCRSDGGAEVRPASPPAITPAGVVCDVHTPQGLTPLRSPLIGRHNLENLLLATAVLMSLGIDPDAAAPALGRAPAVPGRLERCDGPDDALVAIVDYAHTPDALDKALTAARLLTSGRVWCVFGCGGDRDRDKRGLMGAMGSRLADELIITNDNPRTEQPEAIAEAIAGGAARGQARWCVELDRAEAIATAVDRAAAGDVVVVAGKGHETVQVIGDQAIPFDDREVLRTALAQRRPSGPRSGSGR
jgi:UDP-N-acetylmuramoyl-L-alanyl-D-glutamate--2,6-diaminopimelate ligase